MLHISPTKLFKNDQTVCLCYPIQYFITFEYFKVVQGHMAPSAPADARCVSDSWLSCSSSRCLVLL